MNVKDTQQALAAIGWPIPVDGVAGPRTRLAVTHFQAGYAFSRLEIDGVAGPLTWAALADSVDKGGRCSAWFFFREWASAGNGWIRVSRDLAYAMDQYRAMVGGPVRVVSGYRDEAHNVEVGGARSSQHLYGNAADVEQVAELADVAGLGLFSGIGTVTGGRVAHMDVRHVGPNTSGGTPEAPTLWYY